MHNVFSAVLGLIAPVFLAATISNAVAAPAAKDAEDRYVAARDAAIEKISAIYDAGNSDDAARKAEEAATADLTAQMRAMLNESAREGFGPAKLSIDTFSKGDEGFGMLDGLRFDALLGKHDQKAGQDGADGKYVEPKAHIIVTTQTLFERWLRAHKNWWGKDIKNVPQQIGAALEKIDRKTYDRFGNLRQKSEDEYKRCFTQNAPKQPSLAEATRQAERLLSAALNRR